MMNGVMAGHARVTRVTGMRRRMRRQVRRQAMGGHVTLKKARRACGRRRLCLLCQQVLLQLILVVHSGRSCGSCSRLQ